MLPNRHNGLGTTRWWEDLPPRVRERISLPPASEVEPHPPRHAFATGWLVEAGRIVALFLFVIITTIGVLLLALAYLRPTAIE